MNAITILESFDLPTNINAFVQETSRQVAEDPSVMDSLSDAFNIDLTAVEQHQRLTYMQYAIVELIRDETITIDEATDVAIKKTEAMFTKHPYLQQKEEQGEKEGKVRDKKVQALALYEANKEKTTAELVNLLAAELKITKPNARYYVTRVFKHVDVK